MSALTLPVAFSLGEICSKYPTSAGAYYWCFRLASPRRRLLLSWINGWLTMVGVWTVSLSVTFVCFSHYFGRQRGGTDSQIQGTAQLVVAGAGIFLPEWEAAPWQTCTSCRLRVTPCRCLTSGVDLIFLAVTLTASALCIFLNDFLPAIDASKSSGVIQFLVDNIVSLCRLYRRVGRSLESWVEFNHQL